MRLGKQVTYSVFEEAGYSQPFLISATPVESLANNSRKGAGAKRGLSLMPCSMQLLKRDSASVPEDAR